MTNLVIEPMACPQSAILTVPYEDLRSVCDQAWEKNKHSLIKKFDVKFRDPESDEAKKALEKQVGVSKLYGQALVDYVIGKIHSQSDKTVLFIHSVPRVSEFAEGKDANLYFVFYFNPEIEYPYTFNGISLKYEAPDNLEELMIKQLQSIKKVPFSGNINSKCKFALEIEALSTGKKDRTEHKSIDEIDVEEFRTILLTHKSGDIFEYTLEENKEVSVKVIDVFYREDEELDDDFFKSFGYESVAKFKEVLTTNYENRNTQAKKNMAVDHIINEIVTKGKVDPIPVEFISHHIKRIKEEQYNQNGKKNTWERFGVANEEDFEEKLDEFVTQDFMQNMAFRCYAKLNGIEVVDLNKDVDKIVDHMYNSINWE